MEQLKPNPGNRYFEYVLKNREKNKHKSIKIVIKNNFAWLVRALLPAYVPRSCYFLLFFSCSRVSDHSKSVSACSKWTSRNYAVMPTRVFNYTLKIKATVSMSSDNYNCVVTVFFGGCRFFWFKLKPLFEKFSFVLKTAIIFIKHWYKN